MTTQLVIMPRDRFLQAAEKEMIDFERREIEFRKKGGRGGGGGAGPASREIGNSLISRRPPQLAASFSFHRVGEPSPTTVLPFRTLSAARSAACMASSCFWESSRQH